MRRKLQRCGFSRIRLEFALRDMFAITKNKRSILLVLLILAVMFLLTGCLDKSTKKTGRDRPEKRQSQPAAGPSSENNQNSGSSQSGESPGNAGIAIPDSDDLIQRLSREPGNWNFTEGAPVNGYENRIAAGPAGTVQIFYYETTVVEEVEMVLRVTGSEYTNQREMMLSVVDAYGKPLSRWFRNEWPGVSEGEPNKSISKDFGDIKVTLKRLNISGQSGISLTVKSSGNGSTRP